MISSLFTISLSCLTSVQCLHCSPSQFKHILLFHISYHCILHVKMTVIARCCYLWYHFLASSHGCLRIWIFFFHFSFFLLHLVSHVELTEITDYMTIVLYLYSSFSFSLLVFFISSLIQFFKA